MRSKTEGRQRLGLAAAPAAPWLEKSGHEEAVCLGFDVAPIVCVLDALEGGGKGSILPGELAWAGAVAIDSCDNGVLVPGTLC